MKKFLFAILLASAGFIVAPRAHAQVLVIAHSDVTADSVSKADLAKVFLGNGTRLSSGSHVAPVLLKEGTVHNEFLSLYLNKTPISVAVIWRGLVLSGQASMPRVFEKEEDLVSYVAKTPGAIGYIGKDTPHEKVKTLKVL